MPHLHAAPYEKSPGPDRIKRLPPTTLVLLLSLVISLAALTLVSSRGAFSDPTDNLGNSFAAAASFGGITQVQKASAGSAGNQPSITASFGSAPTQDNLLVLVHHYRNTATVTLPAGWAQAVLEQNSGSKITIAYKIAGAAEASDVTVSVSSSDDQTITIFEYDGIDTVSPLDQTASNSVGTGNPNSCSTGTTPTTTTADELVIAGVGLNGTSGGWGNTWTNGFTQQSTVVSTVTPQDQNKSASSTADNIVSATGTFETTESWTTGRKCQAAIATFREPIPYAALSGTVTPSATEAEVVTGAETLIITLTNDTWDATVGADNAVTTALIAGIDSAQGEPAGWDNVVKAGLTFTDVTRTSATVVTVTLPAFTGYNITAAETITVTVPATAVASSGSITATPTFTINHGTAALSGTLVPSAIEAQVVAGTETLIITLTNDTWDATVGADNAVTTALIAGIDSAQGEPAGWDNVVKAGLTFTDVTRTSATVVTVTLPAFTGYEITAAETITVTVPATAVASAGPITATPTFTIEAPTIAQLQTATSGSSGVQPSVTASYGSTPSEDNVLILVHHYRGPGTVTLPAGWTEAVTQQGSGSTITIAYKIPGPAEGTDVTVSVSPSGHQTITIFEYEGLSIVSPLDQTASNFDVATATSCSTGTTPTTSSADQLLIAGVGLNGTSGGWGNTWTNGFTQQSTEVSSGGAATDRSASSTADRIVSATGAYETTESWSAGRPCQAAIVTFQAP